MHAYIHCDEDNMSNRFAGSPPKTKPLVVDMYNKYMLGVDRLDQRMAYYQFTRKTVRWWRKVFFWMVEAAIVNAHILYTSHTSARRPLTQKEFRRELVIALCHDQRSEHSLQRTQHTPDVSIERLCGSYFPETGTVRQDCRVCSVRGPEGHRRLTTTFCDTCSDHAYLCIGECLRRYHTSPRL